VAKKTYRAIGRVQGVTEAPLNHGDEVELEHDHEHTVALVAAGALKLASEEETDDEHAGHTGYSTEGSEKGTTLGDAVTEKKPKTDKPKADKSKTEKPKAETSKAKIAKKK
jgi:hypothetical protein